MKRQQGKSTPEIEIQAMFHIIRSLSVENIYQRYKTNEKFRKLFDAWYKKYEEVVNE